MIHSKEEHTLIHKQLHKHTPQGSVYKGRGLREQVCHLSGDLTLGTK